MLPLSKVPALKKFVKNKNYSKLFLKTNLTSTTLETTMFNILGTTRF